MKFKIGDVVGLSDPDGQIVNFTIIDIAGNYYILRDKRDEYNIWYYDYNSTTSLAIEISKLDSVESLENDFEDEEDWNEEIEESWKLIENNSNNNKITIKNDSFFFKDKTPPHISPELKALGVLDFDE